MIATFTGNAAAGDVSRLTAFVRNNGLLGTPAELHDPLQPLRPPRLPGAAERAPSREREDGVPRRDADPDAAVGLRLPVPRRPVRHRGQPHRRPAGARARPLRVLDRHGHLFLGKPFSVSNVDGTGATARIYKWQKAFPGVHVDGLESWLYPIQPPQLMATPTTTRRERILYPVDWLEERSGLVGGIRYFLFRNVPGDVNWFQTLGSATLTAFIVQATTGVILAMYYKPDPKNAYSSIQYITNDLWAGWLVRGMHRWGASVFIILMFLHMGRVFLFGAYKYPRELNWMIGVLLLALGLAEGFTGYLLPWDQTSYWATTVGININGTAPFLGPFIAQFLQGGSTSTPTR